MSRDISIRVCGGRDWRGDIRERLRACRDMNHELMTPSIFTREKHSQGVDPYEKRTRMD